MGRPRFTTDERKRVFDRPRPNEHPFPIGCWHCGREISFSNFHIDHYPIMYKDIENQVCIGVTDVKDFENLVPSCPACNLSHAFERKSMCGYSQVPITRILIWQVYGIFCSITTITLLILLFRNRK